jgi:hypothetical protein
MKNIYLIILLLISCNTISAQKHDYIWVGGAQNYLSDTTRGGMVIDFKQSPPLTFRKRRELELFISSSVISDTAGNIQVYTDGCDIANGVTDEILPNGHDINPGYVNEFQCHSTSPGNGAYTAGLQSSLFLPLPDSSHKYYLFHKRIKYVYQPSFAVITDVLFYSIVDMQLNDGKGDVIEKNIPVMEDSLTFGMITAVKHANGKDWWVVTPRKSESEIYAFLLTHQGVADTVLNKVGVDFTTEEEGSGQIVFSADGSTMAVCTPFHGINIYDFDRTTGQLSNFRQYPVEFLSITPDVMGCAFSPNGRFLYVTTVKEIFQYDLSSSDIPGTRVLLDTWDGFSDPLPATFLTCQLAPDCKIYVQTGQQARWLHVIHNPNLLGTDCSFQQRGFKLATPNRGSIPFFPNFRLGPLDNPGLPCTSVVGSGEAPVHPLFPDFSVFPNPVRDILIVVPNRVPGGKLRLALVATDGRVAQEYNIGEGNETQWLPVGQLQPGMYAYIIRNEMGGVVQSGRVVVVE